MALARARVVSVLNQLLEDGGALRVIAQDLADAHRQVNLLPKVVAEIPGPVG